jgi:hypothetical protein
MGSATNYLLNTGWSKMLDMATCIAGWEGRACMQGEWHALGEIRPPHLPPCKDAPLLPACIAKNARVFLRLGELFLQEEVNLYRNWGPANDWTAGCHGNRKCNAVLCLSLQVHVKGCNDICTLYLYVYTLNAYMHPIHYNVYCTQCMSLIPNALRLRQNYKCCSIFIHWKLNVYIWYKWMK